MKKRGASILIVDDDQEMARVLRRSLSSNGYTVHIANSGDKALEAVSSLQPDLLLLDLLLPGTSGLEVCHRLRAESPIPIIVLSVKGTEHDKVEALDLGADDYIAKPFGINEVLARVRVALRRLATSSPEAEFRFQAGSLSVDLAARRVRLEGQEISLTPTEYDLLKVFITHRGKLLTRQILQQAVWGSEANDRTHSLHVYVAQLRQKIEPDPEYPRFILTIPGVGYRFNDEETS
jgi:two-component system, OmpR family, KDP operon response regulator KdpE